MKHSLPNGHNQLVSHTFRLLVILSFFFCFSRLAGREDSYTVEEKILKLQKKKEVVFEGQVKDSLLLLVLISEHKLLLVRSYHEHTLCSLTGPLVVLRRL